MGAMIFSYRIKKIIGNIVMSILILWFFEINFFSVVYFIDFTFYENSNFILTNRDNSFVIWYGIMLLVSTLYVSVVLPLLTNRNRLQNILTNLFALFLSFVMPFTLVTSTLRQFLYSYQDNLIILVTVILLSNSGIILLTLNYKIKNPPLAHE